MTLRLRMRSNRLLQIIAGLCLLYATSAELVLQGPRDDFQVIRTRRQAPSVNVHTIPKTSFSCEGKQLGEYYADMETRCQVYHICLATGGNKLSPMSFVCPNGTIFSQASRVCSTYDRVYCKIQEKFYESLHGDLNIHRSDYGNLKDYAEVKYPSNQPARVPASNDLGDESEEDYDEAPATVAPPPPPRRTQRPPSRRPSQRQPITTTVAPQTQAPPRQPTYQSPPRRPTFRQPQEPTQPEPPVLRPVQPEQPVIRRQQVFRQTQAPTITPVVPETIAPEEPQRNPTPNARRPSVYRSQPVRGGQNLPVTTTEIPQETTAPPTNRNLRGRVPTTRVIPLVPTPPVSRVLTGLVNRPIVPQPPPVDLTVPDNVFFNAGPIDPFADPTSRLPPGLRTVIPRPVLVQPAGPSFDARPPPFQPNLRPIQPSVPVTRVTLPPTVPTVSAQTESVQTTTTVAPSAANAGNNNNDYEYYDYEYPQPSGTPARRKRELEVVFD